MANVVVSPGYDTDVGLDYNVRYTSSHVLNSNHFCTHRLLHGIHTSAYIIYKGMSVYSNRIDIIPNPLIAVPDDVIDDH